MATHIKHTDKETFYFITFACYRWLPLFEKTEIYSYLNFWFERLKKKGYLLNGYVIMPNHMHLIVYASEEAQDLNNTISESKRFLAYEIVKRLKEKNLKELLKVIKSGVQENERSKGKKHQVFRLSFDAKPVATEEVERVLDYVHQNPVSGKWNLVDDYTNYPYSSAEFYELGGQSLYPIHDFRYI